MSSPTGTVARFPLLAQLASRDPLDVAPRITLLLLAPLDASDATFTAISVSVACLLAVSRTTYRSPWLWLAIAAVRGFGQWHHWPGLDNHLVLLTYWCLALAFVFFSRDPKRVLALTASLLIGLTFAFATFWKLTSGQFADGRFFEYTLLFDSRFTWIAEWAGGLSSSAHSANVESFADLRASSPGITEADLESTSRIGFIAWVMTGYGIVIEATIAAVFLLPRGLRWIPRARFVAILVFCATTFVLAPVIYFGLTLLTMAYAQTDEGFRHRGWLIGVMVPLVAWLPVYDALSGAR